MLNTNRNVNEETNTRYYIMDESSQFVHADSIKKIGEEYTYTSYPRPERAYPSMDAAQKALDNLKLHNKCGNLNHVFTIKSEPITKPTCFVIKDQNNRFVDANCIFLLPNDDSKQLEWWLTSFSTEINSILRYPTKEYAQIVLEKLNKLKDIAGFTDAKFHIEEFTKCSNTPAKMSIQTILVPKGKKMAHRQLYRETVREFIY
ncbi:hypothetical protein [Ruminiclostridium cellulolyticum]|uniref:Uncharacterized protein n=1 Tax=Ruminiclostridium cellulolyticum (strain ATCC 35319 / DSM 5812 / JCM 6584 / H10) TaxID=394503 RepID=B8I8S7_RUMCH|nr:hypothetical protein [Ruminiclostridium cellulolyticum]ACL77259.1 hypothetical protein Ccel_2965 [Ruminiclostridium cellulolyticum H10]